MITGVAIQGANRYVFTNDPEMDALEHLELMADKGIGACAFRTGAGEIWVAGESPQTVFLQMIEEEN